LTVLSEEKVHWFASPYQQVPQKQVFALLYSNNLLRLRFPNRVVLKPDKITTPHTIPTMSRKEGEKRKKFFPSYDYHVLLLGTLADTSTHSALEPATGLCDFLRAYRQPSSLLMHL